MFHASRHISSAPVDGLPNQSRRFTSLIQAPFARTSAACASQRVRLSHGLALHPPQGSSRLLTALMVALFALGGPRAGAQDRTPEAIYAVPQGTYGPAPYAQGQPGGEVLVVPYGAPPAPNVYSVDPTYVATLQARLGELRAERSRHRLGGPIALMGVSGAITAVGALTLVSLSLASSSTYSDDSGGGLANGVRITGVITALGGAGVIFGGIRLRQRLSLRRQYDPEITEIRQTLRAMGLRAVRFEVTPGGFAGGLHFEYL